MKSSAYIRSPAKMEGSAPIIFTSWAGWAGCWGSLRLGGAGGPPPPPPPPPLPPPPPPPPPPPVGAWRRRARWRLVAISAGEVPGGGWAVVVDEAAGAEVGAVSVVVWTDVVAVVVAIRGNERGTTVRGEANGVRRIA